MIFLVMFSVFVRLITNADVFVEGCTNNDVLVSNNAHVK